MSLVITMKTRNGIVFASDSRSTFVNSTAAYYEEKGRRAQKVFRFGSFILAVTGRNSCMHNGREYRIEDAINQAREDSPGITAKEFTGRMRAFLEFSLCRDRDVPYVFIFGYWHGGQYVVERTEMYYDRIIYRPELDDQIGWSGDVTCFPEKLQHRINRNWTLEEMEAGARMLLGHAIEAGDYFLPYNPVGGEIQVVSFSWPGPGGTVPVK